MRAAVSLLGRFPALAGVDLDVAPGEVVLVQGPNGAGKTTLLRACAGLVPIVSGDAAVLGHDLRRDRRAVRHQVALLGHASPLYDDLTVVDNLRFVARAGRLDERRVADVVEQCDLGGRLAGSPVARLSTGQRRRAALAALLLRPAELWLLDEPHAGLDDAGRSLLAGVVRSAAAAGTTVLLASHELDQARALAGRVVTMAGGQLRNEAQRTREPAGVA